VGRECEFLRAIPAHFGVVCGFLVLAGGFGVDFSSAQMCGWCGFGLFCSFFWCTSRRCFWCMASILARYLLLKNKICTPSVSIFCKKWLKVSLAKMVKKWFENLVVEIIFFKNK